MIKEFFMKKMLEKQLKALPAAQREQIIAVVTKHPAFFEKIAKEVDAKVKAGKDKNLASMEVMRVHQSELQKLMMQG
ncbi:MAG: hypothetical protein AAB391_01005 [Patescibacteria group bacterium]